MLSLSKHLVVSTLPPLLHPGRRAFLALEEMAKGYYQQS
jgi:hypothetical protein